MLQKGATKIITVETGEKKLSRAYLTFFNGHA